MKTNREAEFELMVLERITREQHRLKKLSSEGYGNSVAAGMAIGYIDACNDLLEMLFGDSNE